MKYKWSQDKTIIIKFKYRYFPSLPCIVIVLKIQVSGVNRKHGNLSCLRTRLYMNPTGEGQRYFKQHVLKWILSDYVIVYSMLTRIEQHYVSSVHACRMINMPIANHWLCYNNQCIYYCFEHCTQQFSWPSLTT